MPSPLPPTISTAKGGDGKDVPNNGVLTSNSITFTGSGFPGLRLNITVTANGTPQPPSIPNATVDATAKWSVTLNSLPSGLVVVTFTEDTANPVVSPPAGTVSWSFTISSKVVVEFEDNEHQDFQSDWKYLSKQGLLINNKGPNTASIRGAREFWGGSLTIPTKIDGNVLCFNYYPKDPKPGNIAFSFYNSSNTPGAGSNTNIQCSKVSFVYVCQSSCIARFQDPAGNILSQQPLIISPGTPQTMTAVSSNISVVYIYDASAVPIGINYSALFDTFEFTPV